MKFIDEEYYKNKTGIYKITNIKNNKIYVGKTEDRFVERYWNHSWKLRNNIHDNNYLQKSWNKYGEESFIFEIIEVCIDFSRINDLEIKYIRYYNSFKKGYNLTTGGEGTRGNIVSEEQKKIVGEKNRKHNLGKKHTKETRQKMSESHKGYIKSEEHKNNLSKSLTGKIISEETKQKLKEINTGSNSPVTKLNEDMVFGIKSLLIKNTNQKEISEKYQVSLGIISAIANSRTWTHVVIEGWEEYINTKKPRRKLTIDEVKEIKKLLSEGLNCSEIARMYDICSSTISGIKNDKYFSNISI